MADKYVRFQRNKERYYLATGELGVGVLPDGHAGIELMCGDIPSKNIKGFEIDSSVFPPILYFNWRPNKNFLKTRVGKVRDLEEARKWVQEVNEANDW